MRIIRFVILLGWALASFQVWGQELPELADEAAVVDRGVIDAIYSDDQRIVVGDREYYLEGDVSINGQQVSASGALLVLRVGQTVTEIRFGRDADGEWLILKGVNTL